MKDDKRMQMYRTPVQEYNLIKMIVKSHENCDIKDPYYKENKAFLELYEKHNGELFSYYDDSGTLIYTPKQLR